MLPNHTTILGVIKENINLIFADYTQIKNLCQRTVSIYTVQGARDLSSDRSASLTVQWLIIK